MRLPVSGGTCLAYYASAPLQGGGIKRCFCLTSVCLTSVVYIWHNSKTKEA